jgi:hypothetical protein
MNATVAETVVEITAEARGEGERVDHPGDGADHPELAHFVDLPAEPLDEAAHRGEQRRWRFSYGFGHDDERTG